MLPLNVVDDVVQTEPVRKVDRGISIPLNPDQYCGGVELVEVRDD